jgi:hypothetical protein
MGTPVSGVPGLRTAPLLPLDEALSGNPAAGVPLRPLPGGCGTYPLHQARPLVAFLLEGCRVMPVFLLSSYVEWRRVGLIQIKRQLLSLA